MKKLFVVATLSIAVAAVIKRVTELEKRVFYLDDEINTLVRINSKNTDVFIDPKKISERLSGYDSDFNF